VQVIAWKDSSLKWPVMCWACSLIHSCVCLCYSGLSVCLSVCLSEAVWLFAVSRPSGVYAPYTDWYCHCCSHIFEIGFSFYQTVCNGGLGPGSINSEKLAVFFLLVLHRAMTEIYMVPYAELLYIREKCLFIIIIIVDIDSGGPLRRPAMPTITSSWPLGSDDEMSSAVS